MMRLKNRSGLLFRKSRWHCSEFCQISVRSRILPQSNYLCRFYSQWCLGVGSGWSGFWVLALDLLQHLVELNPVGICRPLWVFYLNSCSWNMLYSSCSILHSFFDAILHCTQVCKSFVCQLAEHQAETTCGRCYRVVSGVSHKALYFLLQDTWIRKYN